MQKRNKFLHYCSDWDFLLIDETDSEIESCTCYSEIVSWYLVGLYRHLETGDVIIKNGEYEWKF